MYYEDINVTKRKTITNGEKYDFYIYNMLSLEKEFSNGKFGKGDTVISKVKDFKLLDDETGEMLDVKIRCSKKLDDALEGLNPAESKKVFEKCLKELENRGLVRDWFNPLQFIGLLDWLNYLLKKRTSDQWSSFFLLFY